MKRIFKYKLEITDSQLVVMPSGAEILKVDETPNDFGSISVWALIDDERPTLQRQFRIVGTGHPAEDTSPENHIGTVVTRSSLVWHVFDLGEV